MGPPFVAAAQVGPPSGAALSRSHFLGRSLET